MVNDDDDDDRHDLTAIGDLTEFLHENDAETDLKFKELNAEKPHHTLEIQTEETLEQDLAPEIASEEVFEESLPPELPSDIPGDGPSEMSFQEESTVFSTEENFDSTLVEDITIEIPMETSSETAEEEVVPEFQEETNAEIIEEIVEEAPEIIEEEPATYKAPETFKEVQNFAQNFSYGEIPSGGNPPFSVLVKNIKFKEDADEILGLLREFKIATQENEKEFIRSTEYGTLLIPQINEYLAIILTHKLRRLDCELEMGLSDQIQPSKSGEYNPRGLTSKTHLNQNRSEKFEFTKDQTPISEIIASTTPTLVGYKITKYHGVETSFRMIESDDLERLHFIQRSLLQELQSLDDETRTDYSDFTSNFHQLYTDLLDEIKEKAFQKNANALLGVSFALTPFLTVQHNSQNKYQLTCTATMASVQPEHPTETNETL